MTDKELDVIRKRQEERLLSRAAYAPVKRAYAPVKREYLSIFAVDAELARAASDVGALLAEVKRLRALAAAVETLEALHGENGTCAAEKPCPIGQAMEMVRDREADNQ